MNVTECEEDQPRICTPTLPVMFNGKLPREVTRFSTYIIYTAVELFVSLSPSELHPALCTLQHTCFIHREYQHSYYNTCFPELENKRPRTYLITSEIGARKIKIKTNKQLLNWSTVSVSESMSQIMYWPKAFFCCVMVSDVTWTWPLLMTRDTVRHSVAGICEQGKKLNQTVNRLKLSRNSNS